MSEELGRVLVTGANGHLGRRLIERLLAPERTAGVQALVRSERAAAVLRPLTDRGPLSVTILNPTDADAVAEAGQGCTHGVHLVGILKEGAGTSYQEAHERTTAALVRAAAKVGVRRIVYLSILGASQHSSNPCLASKGNAERILLEGGVPAVVLRVPMVLGAGDFAARALQQQATATLAPLVRGGASREQPIDAEDVIEATLRALVNPGVEGAILELAGPESLSHRQLVERVAAVLGGRPRTLPVPLGLARLFARFAELVLASPPLTRAMLEVLEQDDAIDPGPACRRLGLQLTPLDTTLRRCFVAGTPA